MIENSMIKDHAMSTINERLSGDNTFAPEWQQRMGADVITHSSRVCDISLIIADECGLNVNEKTILATGALLHDIGKAWVSRELLNKTDPLTDSDRDLINNHAMLGYTHLKRKNFAKDVIDIVYHHHERLNGTGYPEKLTESDGISFYTQIVAVADVYEALTADRVYRESIATREAFTIMRVDDMARKNYNRTGLNQLLVNGLEKALVKDCNKLYIVERAC